MKAKPSDFKFHDSIIPAEEFEQQPGKFGYITWWDYLRMDSSGKLFVEADGVIQRDGTGGHPAILVRAVKGGGLEIELVGGDVLSPGCPSKKKPSKTAIPVKRIKAGGTWYKKWDDEIRYHSIMVMPIGRTTSGSSNVSGSALLEIPSTPVVLAASRRREARLVFRFGA